MIVKESNSNRLVLEERPIIWWLIAGGFGIVAMEGLLNARYMVGTLFLVMSIVVMFVSRFIQVVFDKKRNHISLYMRNMGRDRKRNYDLSLIKDVEIEAEPGEFHDTGGMGTRVCLLMRDGERVPLSSSFRADQEQIQDLTVLICDFLEIESPQKSIWKFDQYVPGSKDKN